MSLFNFHFEPTWLHIAMGMLILFFFGSISRLLNSRRQSEVSIHDRVLEAKDLRRRYQQDVRDRQSQLG